MGTAKGLLGGSRSGGDDAEFDVSIVLPFRQAEHTIAGSLKQVALWARQAPWRIEVIAVDDGSADATEAAAVRWRSYFDGYQLVRHEVKRGMGAAARSGALAARGKFVVVIDPALEVPCENVRLLIQNLAAGCDVAVLSRRNTKQKVSPKVFLERAAETTFMAFSQLVVRTGVRDSLCGMQAYRRRAVRRIAERSQVQGAAFAFEWHALADYFGFHVQECPVRWVRQGSHLTALTAGRAPGMLRDIWRTRKRLAADAYVGALPAKELLHETSFVRLDQSRVVPVHKRPARVRPPVQAARRIIRR
jgi:dolichyl-phosphate beta-glucosyltransferase